MRTSSISPPDQRAARACPRAQPFPHQPLIDNMPNKKQSSKKSSKKPQQAVVVRQPAPSLREVLSHAASDYAVSLRDPKDACPCSVPNSIPLPSQKMKTWIKGSAVVGTAGFGSIIVFPHRMCKYDQNAVYYSGNTGTYALGGTVLSTGTTGAVAATPNSMYATASFSGVAPIQARLVGCALYAWYVGTNNNLQGEFTGLSDPDNLDTQARAQSVLFGDDTVLRVPISEKRRAVVLSWFPSAPADYDFSDQTYNDNASICLLFNGTNSTACVSFEVYAIWEFIGNNAATRTLSASDPNGFAAVLTAGEAQGTSVYEDAKASVKQLLSSARQTLSDMSGPAASLLGKFVGSAAHSYMHQGYDGSMGAFGRHASTIVSIEDAKRQSAPSDTTSGLGVYRISWKHEGNAKEAFASGSYLYHGTQEGAQKSLQDYVRRYEQLHTDKMTGSVSVDVPNDSR